MPTYRLFDKTKDILKEGTKIRIGGRDGKIAAVLSCNYEKSYKICWQDHTCDNGFTDLDLELFPGLEIAEQPLKIDRRVRDGILDRMHLSGATIYMLGIALYLDSLEVVDES